jgi:hypothetical protein
LGLIGAVFFSRENIEKKPHKNLSVSVSKLAKLERLGGEKITRISEIKILTLGNLYR